MRRIFRWFGRSGRELADEIREHIEIVFQENLERGMSPSDARRAAERTFGNAGVLREHLREARPAYWLDTFVQDVRYGLRLLARSPLLAAIVIVTLTFGISLCSTVFTFIEAETMRAHVDRDPQDFLRLVPAYTYGDSHEISPGVVSLNDYTAYRDAASPLAELAAWDRLPTVFADDETSRFNLLLVTCNFFSVYGLEHPKLGRLFRADECQAAGSAPVVVLSEEIWRSRFEGDPAIVGREIMLNRHALTVIGIVPERFSGRNYRNMHAWAPYTMQPVLGPNTRLPGGGARDRFRESGTPWLNVDGRLRTGARRPAVEAALRVAAGQQDTLAPGRRTALFVTDGSQLGDPFRRGRAILPILLTLGSVTLVLLVVCTNAAMLLLSRAAARQREIAIRLSLGAGGFRLIRMLLTESLILAGVAGAASAWLSWRLPEVLRNLFTTEPANYSLKPDWVSFAYLSVVTMLAGCFAGLTPALESLRMDLTKSLKGEGGMLGAGGDRTRTRSRLVIAQVAVSLVLLVLATMVLRANAVFQTDPGFATRQTFHIALMVKKSVYTAETAATFRNQLRERVQAVLGVEAVAAVSEVNQTDADKFRAPGQPPRDITLRAASPEFFETLGIPILQGRTFSKAEEFAPIAAAAIVSDNLARSWWPGENPLTKHIEDAKGTRYQIVGVARALPRSLFNGTGAQVYTVLSVQALNVELVGRFKGDFRQIARPLSDAQLGLNGVLPESLDAWARRQDAELIVLSKLVTGLGLATLLLTVAGLYGVVAFAVRRRTRELGIRVALGARHVEIVRLVLASGMRPVIAGLAGGLLLALGASVVMERTFSQTMIPIDARDPFAYAACGLLLAVAALAAMLGPALRGAASDPVQALRQE